MIITSTLMSALSCEKSYATLGSRQGDDGYAQGQLWARSTGNRFYEKAQATIEELIDTGFVIVEAKPQ